MAKRPDILTRIDQLRDRAELGPLATTLACLRDALADRHPLLVVAAAEWVGDRLLDALEPELLAAYERLLHEPLRQDPGCTAKGAIVRALVAIDCQNGDFFAAGTGYRQLEPVWGGRMDSAVDLRVTCAIGLAATTHPRALIHLVALLHDPEPHARSGAARAIACVQPLAAEAVLRSKALAGDVEPAVTGDCLSELLHLAGDTCLDFVAGFLDDPDPAVGGLAALALGASHLDGALARLVQRWTERPLKKPDDLLLLRAVALHRAAAGLDWLIAIVAQGDRRSAERTIQELAAYRNTAQVRARLAATLAARGDGALEAVFAAAFPEPG